jgi:hypothetical protein
LLHPKDINPDITDDLSRIKLQTKPVRELWDETAGKGIGIIDFRSILLAAKENNIENCYVEVEGSQGNSIEVLKKSDNHLKKIGS